MQDKLRLKGRLKCFSFTPISEWVLRHGNELGETRKFGSPWLGFVPQRISHHSLAIATHTLLFHSAIFLCLFVCVNQRLPPIELFSAIDYHMLIANISLPLCAAVLISTQKKQLRIHKIHMRTAFMCVVGACHICQGSMSSPSPIVFYFGQTGVGGCINCNVCGPEITTGI